MCIVHLSTVGISEAKNKYQWLQQIVCRGAVLRVSSWMGTTLSSCIGVSVLHLAPFKGQFDLDYDKHCARINGDNP